ncbi:MAG: DinB family protein [Actinomycetota bacterium]
MSDRGPGAGLLERLDAVAHKLRRHAASPPAAGLTSPDPPTGERWDWGQVWAHLGEFLPFWMEQVALICRAGNGEPVAFGRVKSDPARVEAIEADRHRPPPELMQRLESQLEDVRGLVASLSPKDWRRRGVHQTLGVMDVHTVFQEFLVGHLEQHAEQLDELARS